MSNDSYFTNDEVQGPPLIGHEELPPIDQARSIEDQRSLSDDHKAEIANRLQALHDYLHKELTEIMQMESEVARDGASHFDNLLGHVKRSIARRGN